MAPEASNSVEILAHKQLFENVPVTEVNCGNLGSIWIHLIDSIKRAQLLAIDLELSGLGDRTGCASSLSIRYKKLREATQTRTILSVGITAFQFNSIDADKGKNITYNCKIFDLLALENKQFVVEPDALTFLSSHGFDFNRWLTHGIGYSKKDFKRGPFHALWEEILASGVCLAFHNGLTDLAFLHEHFYAPLPENSEQFVANLADWFGERMDADDYRAMDCAIWDSKYLAKHQQELRFSATYLDYVFRKAQRDNHSLCRDGKPHIVIKFTKLPKYVRQLTTFSYANCGLKDSFLNGNLADVCQGELCQQYSRHGNCKNRNYCTKEHDVDFLLDLEEKRAKTKREREKRRREKRNNQQIWERRSGEEEREKEISSEESEEEKAPKSKEEKGGRKRKLEETNEENGSEVKFGTLNPNNIANSQMVDNRSFASSYVMPPNSKPITLLNTSRVRHRAGMDAFMTGFAVLFFQLQYSYANSGRLSRRLAGQIPLPGKDYPLLIRKANFVSQTESHQLNWARIESRRRAFDSAKYEQCSNDGEDHI